MAWNSLEKIEFDAVDKLPNSYLNYALKDSESLDYLLSGNKYSSDIYASAFRIDENKIANVGTPRNDQLCLKIDKEVSLFEKKLLSCYLHQLLEIIKLIMVKSN